VAEDEESREMFVMNSFLLAYLLQRTKRWVIGPLGSGLPGSSGSAPPEVAIRSAKQRSLSPFHEAETNPTLRG
jgi:hypothetical protein